MHRASILTFALIFFHVYLINAENIICNGNFTGFNLTSYFDSENYQFLPSNYSCWYDQSGDSIEVKDKLYPPMGLSAELVSTVSYVLCQNVQLEANQTYYLGFTLGNCKSMSYSTITVTMNNAFIMNVTLNGELQVTYAATNFSWNLN